MKQSTESILALLIKSIRRALGTFFAVFAFCWFVLPAIKAAPTTAAYYKYAIHHSELYAYTALNAAILVFLTSLCFGLHFTRFEINHDGDRHSFSMIGSVFAWLISIVCGMCLGAAITGIYYLPDFNFDETAYLVGGIGIVIGIFGRTPALIYFIAMGGTVSMLTCSDPAQTGIYFGSAGAAALIGFIINRLGYLFFVYRFPVEKNSIPTKA